MDESSAVPPIINPVEPPPLPPEVPRGRWWFHLLLLGSYPVVSGLISFYATAGSATHPAKPMLPTNFLSLSVAITAELVMFGVIFGLAWVASRATRDQLLLQWKGKFGPIGRGFLYSIGLRFGILVVGVVVAMVAGLVGIIDENTAAQLRPEVENLIDVQELAKNPLYLFLNLTVVSFVLAGFREELWRAGMLAGFVALFPATFSSLRGQMAAVSLAALLFGVGHVAQGWGGVIMATLLGVGLGAIMVYRQSIWEAVMAHGFFNAASFVALTFIQPPTLVPPG